MTFAKRNVSVVKSDRRNAPNTWAVVRISGQSLVAQRTQEGVSMRTRKLRHGLLTQVDDHVAEWLINCEEL